MQFKIGRITIEYEVKENGCWNVINRSFTKDGYARINIKGKALMVHRVIKGSPENMLVMHTCDNTKCINPEHLQVGTYIDNNKDRDNKNRQAVGENHGQSKLSDKDVELIRLWFSTRFKTILELVKLFNVSHTTIYEIVKNKRYKI